MPWFVTFPYLLYCCTNKLLNSPQKKAQKNGQKTEISSLILVCHFTEKRSMRLFLEKEYRIEKKYWFWPNSKFVTYLTHGHPLVHTHRFHSWNWIFKICRSCVQNLKIIQNTLFEIPAVEWELFWKIILRLCSKNRMKMDSNLFEIIKNGKFG
jgi:hypothetical protein